MTDPVIRLMDSRWLAKRLGLSLDTIERLRAEGSPDLPRGIRIGNSWRYDHLLTEYWIAQRTAPETTPNYYEWAVQNVHRFFNT